MFLRADLVIGTLMPSEEPSDRWCDSGHRAPAVFRREGPLSEALPTRFLQVRKKGINGTFSTLGVYCEPCMILAQYMKAQKQKHAGIESIGKRIASGHVDEIRNALFKARGTKV